MIRLADWKATPLQHDLVGQVLASGRLTYGSITREFERQWAAAHNWQHAVMVNSGTNALKITLATLKELRGWPDDGEVIVPAVTFVATYNAVLMAGLVPVLCDVDETLNLNPSLALAAVNARTVAVLPVHLLGRPAAMNGIVSVLEQWERAVVEDSCECAFTDTGPKGDAACYSTYASHHLVTGAGGMICTNDERAATVARSYAFHGRDEAYLSLDDDAAPSARFRFPRHGYSDRATEMEAALGLGAMADAGLMMGRRLANVAHLADALGVPNPGTSMFFPYLTPDRDATVARLEATGIETREIMPLTNQPILAHVREDDFPVAARVNREGLLLPCHQGLGRAELDEIAATVLRSP